MSGLFNAPRALTVKSAAIPVVAGQAALVPLKLEGSEGLNALFEYRLTLQTPDGLSPLPSQGANFALDAFVGLELSCFIELEGQGSVVPGLPGGAGLANRGAGVREISGLITAARLIGEDSRHARYGAHNQNSSCWLRVASTWAGNQLGAMYLPRIGEEVVVDFLGGDPDLPLVSGRVYNQLNQPPWSLPQQQALSGLRSRELTPGGGNSAAGRSNHLILDDTHQKIQAQLHSDHQHSSLSLGHISRIEDNAGRKDARGEGFELRTDGHGVLRAKDGLLISTEARPNAQAHAKDMGETTARLRQAQDQHENLADLARQHQAQDAADQGVVAQAMQQQNQGIEGAGGGADMFPELAEPHITLASPTGVASTTPGSTHHHSGAHHAITSGAHTSICSQKSLLAVAKEAVRLFAYKSGMKLISAASDIHIKALKTSIHLLAKMDITLTSSSIVLAAKKQVLVNGGGSYMRWDTAGIEEGTAGMRTVHAATHPVAGPDRQCQRPRPSRALRGFIRPPLARPLPQAPQPRQGIAPATRQAAQVGR